MEPLKQRNDKVFQVHFEYRDPIYSHSLRMVETGLHDPAQTRSDTATLPSFGRTKAWCKPPSGWYKLNTNGAIKRGLNIGTCGGVTRDDAGCSRMGFAKRLGICFVLDSELRGLLEGLLSAWSLNIQYLMVETDCFGVYRLIMEANATHNGSTLLQYILELISRP
ncbi:hypothetical protein V6N11_055623 [Hibiscus sabdariffa]|uniref:RNase H type-1 domain-containing protein n=1 Tax=Hibiscus sabdariffa TaxID=183260 RepID=A0ABR2NR50_9ROSI